MGKNKKIKKGELDTDSLPFKWDIRGLLLDFPAKEIDELTKKLLLETIIPRLQAYENKTWGQITGNESKEHHNVNFADSKDEKKRVVKWLRKNESHPYAKSTEFFSFRVTGKKRLYGVREIAIFRILFYDHFHSLHPSEPNNT